MSSERGFSGWLIAAAIVANGCVVANGTQPPPAPPRERCPYESAPMQVATTDCPPEVLEPFVNTVSAFSHRNWDPQKMLQDSNRYVDRYGGKAMMTILGMRLDARGKVSAVSLTKSSGDEDIDQVATNAFHLGASVGSPPACALKDGGYQFRLGLCLEVIPSARPRLPHLRIDWERGVETSMNR